jgi:hypothetical protein
MPPSSNIVSITARVKIIEPVENAVAFAYSPQPEGYGVLVVTPSVEGDTTQNFVFRGNQKTEKSGAISYRDCQLLPASLVTEHGPEAFDLYTLACDNVEGGNEDKLKFIKSKKSFLMSMLVVKKDNVDVKHGSITLHPDPSDSGDWAMVFNYTSKRSDPIIIDADDELAFHYNCKSENVPTWYIPGLSSAAVEEEESDEDDSEDDSDFEDGGDDDDDEDMDDDDDVDIDIASPEKSEKVSDKRVETKKEDSVSDDETPPKTTKKKAASKKTSKAESDDAPKKVKKTKKAESDSEDEAPKKVKKTKKAESDSEDEAPKKVKNAKKAESDNEDEAPKKVKKAKKAESDGEVPKKVKKAESDDEEPQKLKKRKADAERLNAAKKHKTQSNEAANATELTQKGDAKDLEKLLKADIKAKEKLAKAVIKANELLVKKEAKEQVKLAKKDAKEQEKLARKDSRVQEKLAKKELKKQEKLAPAESKPVVADYQEELRVAERARDKAEKQLKRMQNKLSKCTNDKRKEN